jgi:hypothetical protein
MSSYLEICKQYNLPVTKNAIGSTGENIAKAILEFFPNFKVVFLGEKFPVVDFYVEVEEDGNTYPFLIQVKATTSNLTTRKCLCVAVPNLKYQSLHSKPIPTYVGGVHIDTAQLYIAPTYSSKKRITSIKPNCVLSIENKDMCAENMNRIKNDVKAYWDCLDAFNKKKEYVSTL